MAMEYGSTWYEELPVKIMDKIEWWLPGNRELIKWVRTEFLFHKMSYENE